MKYKGAAVNPTQKPVTLMRSFISDIYSPEKIVLDLTSGSGLTAVAAASLGYNSFTCDIRKDQIERSIVRLQAENALGTLRHQ